MATSRCKKFTFSDEVPPPSSENMGKLVTIGNQLSNSNSQSTVNSLKSANLLNYKKPTNVFLKSFDEAYLVAKDCLEKMKPKTQPFYNPEVVTVQFKLPKEVQSSLWELSVEAAERTLRYIYEEIHHTCYMLCVKGKYLELYKLESSGLPEHIKEQVDDAMEEDPLLKKMFRGKDLRLMGCLLKERRDESTISEEYLRWIASLEQKYIFPDGVFILNLTDAVIIPNDFDNGTVLPVLGGSGHVNCLDITIPNYDDVRIRMGYNADFKSEKNILFPPYETDWNKKINKAVFRGGPTGCGTTSKTNMRLRLAEMKNDVLDVGISWKKEGETKIRGGNARFDPVRGLSMVESDVPPVPFMTMKDQSKHKYLIHIDGNVAAYRLLQSMLTGSLILKVNGPYTLWVDHLLQEGVHYVSVKKDLSNLEKKIKWCKRHDEECRVIAQNAFEFAKDVLYKNFMDIAFCELLWSVSKQPMVNIKPIEYPPINQPPTPIANLEYENPPAFVNNLPLNKTKKSKKNKKNKNSKTKKSKRTTNA
jgi:hypothetical protein